MKIQMRTLRTAVDCAILISMIAISLPSFTQNTRAQAESASVTLSPDAENYQTGIIQNNVVNVALSSIYTFITKNESQQVYPDYVQFFKDLGINMFRYPAGCQIDTYDWKDLSSSKYGGEIIDDAPSVDDAFVFADDSDSDIIFEMSVVDFFDGEFSDKQIFGCYDYEVTPRWTETDIRWFVEEYTLKRKREGKKYIKHYELGNEEWSYNYHKDGDPDNHDFSNKQFLSPTEYVNAAVQVSEIIRDAVSIEAPEVQIIGVSDYAHYGFMKQYGDVWGEADYRNYGEHFDLITFHGYFPEDSGNDRPEGDALYGLDYNLDNILGKFENNLGTQDHLRKPAITEWNLKFWSDFRNIQKHEHSLYDLGHLIKQAEWNIPMQAYLGYANIKLVLGGPDDFEWNSAQLIYSPNGPVELTAPGKSYKLFYETIQDIHIKTEINAPKRSVPDHGEIDKLIGTSSKTASGYQAILLNRGENELNTTINIEGETADLVYSMTVLNAPSLDSDIPQITVQETATNVEVQNGFTITIPAYSAVALEITGDTTQFEICDINQDQRVWIDDYNSLISAYGTSLGDPDYNSNADLDDNGYIGIFDYNLFVSCFIDNAT